MTLYDLQNEAPVAGTEGIHWLVKTCFSSIFFSLNISCASSPQWKPSKTMTLAQLTCGDMTCSSWRLVLEPEFSRQVWIQQILHVMVKASLSRRSQMDL